MYIYFSVESIVFIIFTLINEFVSYFACYDLFTATSVVLNINLFT